MSYTSAWPVLGCSSRSRSSSSSSDSSSSSGGGSSSSTVKVVVVVVWKHSDAQTLKNMISQISGRPKSMQTIIGAVYNR